MDNLNSPGASNGHDRGNGDADHGDAHDDHSVHMDHMDHLDHGDQSEWEHSHGEGRHGHQASLGDALDFVNTLEYDKGLPDDYLKDVPTAVHWLQDHALLHREMVDDLLAKYETEDGTPLMNRIWRTREALRELLDATV